MDGDRLLRRCLRTTGTIARRIVAELRNLGFALIGMPIPTSPPAPAVPPPPQAVGEPSARPGPHAVAESTEPGGADQPMPRRHPLPERRPPSEPILPAGHPERLIPHIPPSRIEQELWSQLR